MLLLAKFWAGFYLVAKYGHEQLAVGADKLFKEAEAELAAEHARECLSACEYAVREIARGR